MSEDKSPLDRLLARPDFRPFSGPHAFRVLGMAKKRLNIPPVREDDILKAVSSLGVVLETEVAMILALQQKICQRCGNCCRSRGSIRVKKEELQTISEALHMEYRKLKERVNATPMGDGTFLMSQPCPFQRGDLCAIYAVRPGTCRGYPSNDMLFYMGRGKNIEDCPISDTLLTEIVVKRVLEEQMWREHPEELKALAEKRRSELTELSKMSQSERMKILVEGYTRGLSKLT
jgi:Fe-S-cluster containining protein